VDAWDTSITLTPLLYVSIYPGYKPSIVHITHIDEAEGFLVGQNMGLGSTAVGNWSRLDWVYDESGGLHLCHTHFNAADEASAKEPHASHDHALYASSGCGGFAFSALTLKPPSATLSIAGEYVDAWDTSITLTPLLYVSIYPGYKPSIVHITHIDEAEGFLVGQNMGLGSTAVGNWSRLDWVYDESGGLHLCHTHFNAADEASAKEPHASHDHALYASSGCGGFAFSALTPTTMPPAKPPPSFPPPQPEDDDDDSDPCFSRESTTVCRLTQKSASPERAYQVCFGGAAGQMAVRTLMSELTAGDLILSDERSVARVVVNQHLGASQMSRMLTLHFESGKISLTPDHVVFLDGAYTAARNAKVGSLLAPGRTITAITSGIDTVINPVTTSGKVLAADNTGLPVVAASGNEWIADVMLSRYPQYTLSFALAAAYPASVQSYYNVLLNAFFDSSVSALARLKVSMPTTIVAATFVLADVLLAIGFLLFGLFSHVGMFIAIAIVGGVSIFMQKKKAKAK